MSWFDTNANTGVDGGGDFMSGIIGGMRDMNWGNALGGLAGLYGGIQGMGTANRTNQQVQSGLSQNQASTQAQIDALNQQIATNRQQAQDAYNRSLGDVTSQNSQLQGNIDTMTGNLNALNDPNSPYMQMARQSIERKDAAAGRRSQWGDREVQLAGTLADYVGKYAPGLNNSITNSRNQINQNNQGLASLYSNMNNPADRNTMSLLSALQQQLRNSEAINTTGRGSANEQTNTMQGLLRNGGQLLGGAGGLLGRLFGGNQDSAGITSLWGGNTGLGSGGWGNLGSQLYGSSDGGWGFGDQGLGTGMGFTGGGLGGGFLDMGGTGSLGSGLDFQSGGLGQGLQGYGTSFGGGGYSDWGDYGDY